MPDESPATSPIPVAEPGTAAPMHITTSVLQDMITNTAGPVAEQAAQKIADNLVSAVNTTTTQLQTSVTNTIGDAKTQLENTVAGLVTAHKAEVSQQLAAIEAKVVANAESDPVTERYVILAVLGTLLLAGLILLVAALTGNPTADHYIGAVAFLFGAPLLSILKTGIPISQAVSNTVKSKLPANQ